MTAKPMRPISPLEVHLAFIADNDTDRYAYTGADMMDVEEVDVDRVKVMCKR